MSFSNHGRGPENSGGKGSFFKEHIQKNNGCAPSAGCTGTVRWTAWEDEITGKEIMNFACVLHTAFTQVSP